MGIGVSLYIRNLVATEMRGRVAAARQHGDTLVIPSTAAQIAREYPGLDYTEEDLRNRLFAEATEAGVEVEISSTRPH